MNIKITLTEQQIDTTVVDDLKQSLDMQFNLDTDEGGEYLEPDYELIDALKKVLQYYMPHHEIQKFIHEVALKEATVRAQLMEKKRNE